MPSSACDWSSDVCSSDRSEEHTSELQSRSDLVCRLLLEKKKQREDHVRAHASGDGTLWSATRAFARGKQTSELQPQRRAPQHSHAVPSNRRTYPDVAFPRLI